MRFFRRTVFLVIFMTMAISASGASQATEQARHFMEKYTATIRPLEIAANRAWWDANITGKDEDYKRKEEAQNRIDAVLSDKKAFAEVKAFQRDGGFDDPFIRRAQRAQDLHSLRPPPGGLGREQGGWASSREGAAPAREASQ